MRIDGDLAAPARQELARVSGRAQVEVAIALGEAEQTVEPVPRGGHSPRPTSLCAEVVEVGVDGDAERAIVSLVAERVDVRLGGLSRRKAARSALAFSRMSSRTVGGDDSDTPGGPYTSCDVSCSKRMRYSGSVDSVTDASVPACIYCGCKLNVPTRPAHVFPEGLGGRLATTTTVCNDCNNAFRT